MISEINDIEIINQFLKNFNQGINDLNNPFKKYIGFILNDEIVSFLNYSLIYDRIEIDYIYTLKEFRNQSLATKLLNYLVDIGNENNCHNITLEVRKSNTGAIKFYKKNDFEIVSIRKNYYQGEDGILMLRKLV